MSDNVTITGNKAQFNEDVTFLKDILIKGGLKATGLSGDGDGVFIGDDLTVDGITSLRDLVVSRFTDLQGITTSRSDLIIGAAGLGITIRPFSSDATTHGIAFLPNSGVPQVSIGANNPSEYQLYVAQNVQFGKYRSTSGQAPLTVKYDPRVDEDLGTTIGGVGIHNETPGIISGQLENYNTNIRFHVNKSSSKSVVITKEGNIGAGIGIITSAFDDRNHKLAINEFLTPNYMFVNDAGAVGIGTSSIGSFDEYNEGEPIKLDILGGARIKGYLYDSANSPGVNGYYLKMDEGGIRWAAASPVSLDGIYVQDEGIDLPNPGAAQIFQWINFRGVNSLGLGTDNVVAIADPDNPTAIARIQTRDLWGYKEDQDDSPIYRQSKVGIFNADPTKDLDVFGTLGVSQAVEFESTLDVEGATTLNNTLDVNGNTNFNSENDATSQTSGGSVTIDGGAAIAKKLYIGGVTTIENEIDSNTTTDGSLVVKGGVGIVKNTNIGGNVIISGNTGSIDKNTGALIVELGGVGIEENLNVGGATTLTGNLELNSSLTDIFDSTSGPGMGQTDWRLSSVGTGVSWRPSGVQTKRTIWVTKNGNDDNSGLLEGDAKATIGAAASISIPTDTIKVRPGIYYEDNPIGLRTDVSVTGEDLRLVTVIPNNPLKDVFHVRNGCLVENLNFTGKTKYTSHKGAGAVAFPSTIEANKANTGYIQLGPFKVPPGKRYKSPYVRNCTNFMCESIGMKIDGDHATAETFGQDLKSMVCDSFTQYNEAGVGVSLTNDGYAQLVSIFTINCDIAIFAGSGGQCDLTNSNSSFGNFGLVAVGLGSTQFTGFVSSTNPAGDFITSTEPDTDIIVCADVFDSDVPPNARRPFDGQALYFKINLDNYPDVQGSGILEAPLERLDKIVIETGADVTGYSALDPPSVIIRDADGTQEPKGPQGIIAEGNAVVDATGKITSINVVATGRNYLPTQNIVDDVEGNTGIASAQMEPIYYTVETSTFPVTTGNFTGITTITFNEFIPYQLFTGDQFSLQRISRILTSSHSFEYVGTGTDINISTPLQGALPIKENEIVASKGAQIPFTSTDQKGNFDIGEGIQVDQTTSTIRGRDFSRAIQAEVTPLILALR